MLVTDLEHVARQISPMSGLDDALRFLQEFEGQDLSDGRIDVDGDRVFAIVQTYETASHDTPRFEGHRKYVDIQYVASGQEVIGWAPTGRATITEPYVEGRDAWLGTVCADEVIPVRLSRGQLVVLWPEDAHSPGQTAGAPSKVRKIVVKIALPE